MKLYEAGSPEWHPSELRVCVCFTFASLHNVLHTHLHKRLVKLMKSPVRGRAVLRQAVSYAARIKHCVCVLSYGLLQLAYISPISPGTGCVCVCLCGCVRVLARVLRWTGQKRFEAVMDAFRSVCVWTCVCVSGPVTVCTSDINAACLEFHFIFAFKKLYFAGWHSCTKTSQSAEVSTK